MNDIAQGSKLMQGFNHNPRGG